MLNIDFTFLWVAVNLLILYLFLRKFLFKRVGDHIEQRSQGIADDIQKAEELKAEAEEHRRKYAEILDSAVIEKQRILSEAQQKATKVRDAEVAEAKREATHILQAAHEDAGRERDRMLAGLKNEVTALALSAATKVIQANMDSEKNRTLVEEFLKNEGAA